MDKGQERGEVLVSASTDGKVIQWSMRKGLEHTDLMRLKRLSSHNRTGASAKNE